MEIVHLLLIFQTHKDSAEVQLAGATLIMALSANGRYPKNTLKLGQSRKCTVIIQNFGS